MVKQKSNLLIYKQPKAYSLKKIRKNFDAPLK